MGNEPRRVGNRCHCGRNLDYPLEKKPSFVVCRCGRSRRVNRPKAEKGIGGKSEATES